MSYANLINADRIPQTEPLNDRQVRNNGGGFSFEIDKWGRLDRFLILGSDAPTYYQSARALTRENAKSVEACWNEDAQRTAARIVEISVSGRAPKNSPAIFALALGNLNEDLSVRQAALGAVGPVCRTASHLFEFAALLDALGRGFGRSVARAFSDWYEKKPVDKLAYQMTKYRSRSGYSHERLIQRVRPKAADGNEERVALYRWACDGHLDGYKLPDLLVGHLDAMKTDTAAELVPLIERYGLTWEQIPTWALTDVKIWEALLPNLGMTALLRNLSTMTSLGVIAPLRSATAQVIAKLTDPIAIKASRLHPYSILNAIAVYRLGRSIKGERTWKPLPVIMDALEKAFYLSFGNVEPTGKRHLLGLDVSGSMTTQMIGGVLAARDAAAAMAMVTARTEVNHHFVAFSNGISEPDIRPSMSFPDVIESLSGYPFQGTDCAAPMLHALKTGMEVDVFVIYTDNDTNSNSMHPAQALAKYRRETGIPAKLVVAGMTSTGFSIADPKDGGMLDIVGFDADAVSIMADFVRS